MYEQLQASITTQTYDNSFYVVALLSGAGAVIALLFLRSGKSQAAASAHPVEI
jgi:hypothetical protein